MLPDQIGLGKEGVHITAGNNRFEVPDAGNQQSGLRAVRLAGEIGFYTIPQDFGLADVDNFILLILEKIDPRQSWYAF